MHRRALARPLIITLVSLAMSGAFPALSAAAAGTDSAKASTTGAGNSSKANGNGSADGAKETGHERACTMIGTNGNDHMYATHGYEVICGLGGDDVIVGGDGDDVIVGGDGNDTIVGGGGSDEVQGGNGNDTIDAGPGNDTVDAGAGDDTVDGGPGADAIEGGAGLNTCKADPSDTAHCSDLKLPEVDGASLQWTADPRITTNAIRTVKLRLRLTDDVSGVDYAQATLSAPAGSTSATLGAPKLVSGTANDGVWELTATIPAFSPVGAWRVTQIAVKDRVNQYRFYNLAPSGAYTTYDKLVSGTIVVGSLVVSGVADTKLPEVAGAQWVTDTRVDNSAARPVTLRVHLSDDVSGVDYAQATLSAPTGTSSLTLGTPKLVSGTALDGVWELTGVVPANAPVGGWRVTQLAVKDRINQYRFYNIGVTGAYTTYDGLVSGTIPLAPLTVAGVADRKLPEAAGAQWATDTRVDNSAARTVKLRLHLTDDVSGVDYAQATVTAPTGTTSLTLGSPKLVSGTALDGVWELTGSVPAFAPLGEWKVTQIAVKDRVNQYRFYNIGPGGAYTTYDGLVSGTIAVPALVVYCPIHS